MAKKTSKQNSGGITGWKWFWVVKHIAVAAVLAVLLVLGAKILLDIGTKHGKYLEVPELVGLKFEEAQQVAEQLGMRVEISDSVYSKTGRGLVREQNPAAGKHVKDGRRVLLTMNALGVQRVPMPNLVGYSARQAVAELNSRGLVLGKFIYVGDMATNNVLKQKYRGRDVEPGDMVEAEARIDLVVGLNPSNSETLIPNVIGRRAVEASRELNDYYINVRGVRYDRSVKTLEDSLKAVVYKQSPDASELPVKMGTDVTLYLRVEEVEAQ